ncbi:glycosyltransferase [Haloplasma contractile]|uniref:Sucrose-phosphate synthase protein n=1 Tax=Haloplasma contractile SSD-17B TaxID=1033810 RepID=U2FI89_9MOLU|nr:glycosyltransferase [Haloplasma contractile]ERJ10939.1 sucrose-phosphate synthase protein [Haloplasma contractile SSD-17B]
MKIMVFDVPAESGGALTILKQYYDAAIKDKDSEWIFVVSTPNLNEYENIKVLNYPWIKKSWFHRLYFDNFVAHKLVENYDVDEVLSLQNILVPKVKIRQTLYLHQSLPFAEKRYGVTENFKFWVYQNIISKMIFKSIRKADKVIVQSKWIIDAVIKKTRISKKKLVLKQPEIKVEIKKQYKPSKSNIKLFFYPAGSMIYKNHDAIVKACKLLHDKKINNFKVVFTLNGYENSHISSLKAFIDNENLPIDFIGMISIEKVYDFYSKSVLLFPSFIETFGLPLLEAKMHQTPIIASDCAFSREILDDYNRVEFFDPFNSVNLSEKMLTLLNK